MSDASIEARDARSVGCPACLNPGRWKRHRERLGCSLIEARRDQVADLYRGGLSEREVAAELGPWAAANGIGISPTTAHFDLEARGVAMRPQTAGLEPYKLEKGQQAEGWREGKQPYLAKVERMRAERGLFGTEGLLERLRRAGVPRSRPAIVGYVRDALIEPERGLGFDKPWLFTEASAGELIERLRDYPDGRLTCWNATTPQQARTRAAQYQARHKSSAEFGRVASVIAGASGKRAGPSWQSNIEERERVFNLRAEGLSIREIARRVFGGETEASGRGKVARLLKKRPVT